MYGSRWAHATLRPTKAPETQKAFLGVASRRARAPLRATKAPKTPENRKPAPKALETETMHCRNRAMSGKCNSLG
eukprot:gene22262-biopygen2722